VVVSDIWDHGLNSWNDNTVDVITVGQLKHWLDRFGEDEAPVVLVGPQKQLVYLRYVSWDEERMYLL
jgi:hypothetical protein